MQHMGSFLAFIMPPFAIGFVAMCFWWRWWLLFPIGIAAATFGKLQYDGVMASDGPGMVMGVILVVFLSIGAGSGAFASALVIAGRALEWKALKPRYVLPTMFLLGGSSYFVYSWTWQTVHAAHYATPPASCLNGVYPAKLGRVDLKIPIAPGLFLWGEGGRDDHYILWSNPDTRAFCSKASDGPVPLRGVDFMIDGFPARRKEETKRPFCERSHPEYPWARMACELIPTEVVPDSPVRVNIEVPKDDVDWIANEREAMLKNPVSVAADGVKTYLQKYDFYLERPDGYFAHCHKSGSSSQPWLYCSVREKLPEGLAFSYDFRTTETMFLKQSPVVAANAHAIFQSLR